MRLIVATPEARQMARGLAELLYARDARITHEHEHQKNPSHYGNPARLALAAGSELAAIVTRLINPGNAQAEAMERKEWIATRVSVFLFSAKLSAAAMEMRAALILAHWADLCRWHHNYPGRVIVLHPKEKDWEAL